MATNTPDLSFASLSTQALEELSNARGFVSQTATRLVGTAPLMQSEEDLPSLQALVDHVAMKNANFEAWVAVGIAFGDALAAFIPGLHWRQVTDQYGSHSALQYLQKTVSIAAPTMLWKRVERGESIDLVHIANELRSFINENAQNYGNA